MNRNIFKAAGVILLMIFISCASRKTGITKTPSDKEIDSWFKKNAWSGGLKLVAFSDINKREFYVQYHKHPEWWDKAFAYLRDNDLTKAPVGKVPLVGDSVFVTVSDPVNKEIDKTMWESHKKFIDLQYVADGKERIDVTDPSKLTVTTAYNDARDVANYTGEGKTYIAEPGTYYLFFPSDAHRPVIKVPGYDKVRKVVVKIRYSK